MRYRGRGYAKWQAHINTPHFDDWYSWYSWFRYFNNLNLNIQDKIQNFVWEILNKKVPQEFLKSRFIADKRCQNYLYTCSTFMCFFITLLAVTILNHSVDMSLTSFDHILKQIILWWIDVDLKFTRLVSCWVLTKMTVWFSHIIEFP